MHQLLELLRNKKTHVLFLGAILILITVFFRFYNLGYSDFDSSELTVMDFVKNFPEDFTNEYFINRRKGPMQWITALTPLLFEANIYNEFVFRVPFALASILSVYFFFKFIREETKDFYVAIIAAVLFSVNGFHVVFGRIVQYQALNLLFSYLALYLVAKYAKKIGKKSQYWLLGAGIAWSISFLAHWDAIFVVAPILYIFIRDKISFKKLLTFAAPIALMTLVFLVPYILNHLDSSSNQVYLSERIGIGFSMNLKDFIFRTELFNPFLFLPLFAGVAIAGLATIKKTQLYYIQLAFTALYFIFLSKSPGSHVYNLYIPLFIIFAVLTKELYLRLGVLKLAIPIIVLSVVGFLSYQSYLLMLDTKVEYPFERERILDYKTKKYSHENLTRHIFGFTHNRMWEEIGQYLDKVDPTGELTFVTNGSTDAGKFYLNRENGKGDEFFVVGIKKPINFVNDYKMSYIKGKTRLTKIKGKNGETVAEISIVGR